MAGREVMHGTVSCGPNPLRSQGHIQGNLLDPGARQLLFQAITSQLQYVTISTLDIRQLLTATMTGETPEVRSDKKKPREDRQRKREKRERKRGKKEKREKLREKERKREIGEKRREKERKICTGSIIIKYQSVFNSQKEKLNILAAILEFSKTGSGSLYIYICNRPPSL